MTIRQILVSVWQRHITPREGLDLLERSGVAIALPREEILDLLREVAGKTVNVTQFLRATGQEA